MRRGAKKVCLCDCSSDPYNVDLGPVHRQTARRFIAAGDHNRQMPCSLHDESDSSLGHFPDCYGTSRRLALFSMLQPIAGWSDDNLGAVLASRAHYPTTAHVGTALHFCDSSIVLV